MEKRLISDFASEIVEQSRGRISSIDAEALAIVYISKMKNFNPTKNIRRMAKEIVKCKL
ncbi:hypothetical protein ACIQ7N_01600 [Lysinibacillus sp. NPDC095746]|uniref:hypothetical protein n=1 Tax=unclassified Lysinibacillus TaxID=2636778 RepID=UPI00236447C8|nr:hypothetical protein [Lysinibacillus sp. CNPSo 3705]MDD1503175.1 hypothetical protein [Lysinibacillus sp. CNPSo 3705]